MTSIHNSELYGSAVGIIQINEVIGMYPLHHSMIPKEKEMAPFTVGFSLSHTFCSRKKGEGDLLNWGIKETPHWLHEDSEKV